MPPTLFSLHKKDGFLAIIDHKFRSYWTLISGKQIWYFYNFTYPRLIVFFEKPNNKKTHLAVLFKDVLFWTTFSGGGGVKEYKFESTSQVHI